MVSVRCEHCGACYETELPLRAIERIRRCSRCGYAALIPVVEADDAPVQAEAEPHEPSAGA